VLTANLPIKIGPLQVYDLHEDQAVEKKQEN
jgi:hypothetical protein